MASSPVRTMQLEMTTSWQQSARHIYPHAIPALYARCVDGLTVKDSTVRFVGENEAWDGSVAELEHCRRAKLELEKLV